MTTYGSKYRGTKEYHFVYCKLLTAAQQSMEISYKEVADILGIHTPGNHMAREVGEILGEISEDEHNAGRPLLSALAVGVNNIPGEGFFNLARRLGKLTATGKIETTQFWRDEQRHVYETWRSKV
jgi:hypothetical protein